MTSTPPQVTYVVSRTGTRHIRRGYQPSPYSEVRIYALCGFGIKPDNAQADSEATVDCQFCEVELDAGVQKP